jgi:putative protease
MIENSKELTTSLKLVGYIDNENDINDSFSEFIISPQELSRLGRSDFDESIKFARICKERGIKTTLEWDILMTEERFQEVIEKASKYIESDLFDTIRVQDQGAIFYIKTKFPHKKIQLVLETGNHNFEAITGWIDFVGSSLDRIVLSIELPEKVLESYISKLDVDVEFLALGPILLFYSPRSLVSPHFKETNRVIATSEESGHKDFIVIENDHGTFMFNPKDFSLLDQLETLERIGLTHIRLDLRFFKEHGLKFVSLKHCKDNYPRPVIRGYFLVNKSDVIFKKLKNETIQRNDENYLGEVLEVSKKNYVAIMIKSSKISLKVDDVLTFQTPERKVIKGKVTSLKDSSGEDILEASKGQLVIINHVRGTSVRTAVYSNQGP